MKATMTILAVCALCAGVLADDAQPTNAEPVVATTLFADGSTNTWTAADLQAALGLMNRKYHRDCETEAGRRAWHGALRRQIVDTNALTKTEIYADGTSFTFGWKAPRAVPRPRTTLSTNGIPARLAAARARRAAEAAATNEVTIVSGPGAGGEEGR